MLAKLTGMTYAMSTLITHYRAGALEFVENSGTGMTEASMPNRRRSCTGDEGLVGWGDWGRWDGVEVARAITVNDLSSGLEVLNRKNKGVKFRGDGIITSELANKDKILNKRGNTKNTL
jgi:hypothetical protein